jgi:hypothetical protein
MMNTIAKILFVLCLILGISTAVLIKKYQKEKAERIRVSDNLVESKTTWRDQRGLYISQVSTLNTTMKEMKTIFKRDSSLMVNNYEKRIYSINNELKNLKIDYARLRRFIETGMVVRDTIYIEVSVVTDTTVSGVYVSKHLNANIILHDLKYFSMDYAYKDTIRIVDVVSVKRRANGKKHFIFPNWRWLWGQTEESIVYSSNPKATIEGHYSVKVKK